MRKSKLFFVILILSALLLPTLIISVSSSTTPSQGALLLQAINTVNSQTTTSEMNQQYVQTMIATTQNFEGAELQQKEISAKASYLSTAWISSRVDKDYDGYCCEITLRWDANTDEWSNDVYVEVLYRDEDGYVDSLGSSDTYTIYDYEASDPMWEYMNIVYYVRGVYDFSIVLYDAGTGVEQDRIAFGEDFDITNIYMESEEEDNFSFMTMMMTPLLSTIASAGGSSILPWVVVGIVGLVILGVIYYKIKSGREKPSRPSTFPAAGPTPYGPPPFAPQSTLARSLGAITCPQCGYANLPSAKFCVRCGNFLEQSD
nr:choice-of-anchor H family protein [Candidatus Freyarchaeota archaeon]